MSGPNIVQTSTGTIGGTTPLTSDPLLGPLQNNNGPTPTMAIPSSGPAYQAGTPVAGIPTDQRNFTRPATNPSLGAFDPQGTPPPTTTVANNATASFNENAQNVTLRASVSSAAGAVNGGTVTFTVLQGSNTIGAATTSGTVSNGQASVVYALPPGLAAGPYTINATYNPSSSFEGGSDTSHTLTINPAATTLTANDAAAAFSTNTQDVTLTADVTSDAGSVNEGTVTFTLKQGSMTIGTAVTSNTVSDGAASVTYVLPAALAAGTYTIDATYNPGNDFVTNSDSTHRLTVGAASTTTAAGSVTVPFNAGTKT